MIDIWNKIPEEFNYFLKNNKQLGVTPVVFETGPEGERMYDIFSRLMKERIIYFKDVVHSETANIVKAQLLFLDSQEYEGKKNADITMYLDSPGGSIYAGLGLYDTMQYIKSDMATVCVGIAASMASVLLTAGTKGKRFALPNSTIMLHQPLGGTEGQADDIRIMSKEITRLEDILMDIYVKHTGQPKEKIINDTRRDNFMTATQAKEYNLIDAVIEKLPK